MRGPSLVRLRFRLCRWFWTDGNQRRVCEKSYKGCGGSLVGVYSIPNEKAQTGMVQQTRRQKTEIGCSRELPNSDGYTSMM